MYGMFSMGWVVTLASFKDWSLQNRFPAYAQDHAGNKPC